MINIFLDLWAYSLIISEFIGDPNVSWAKERSKFQCILFWLYPNTQLGHTNVGATKPEKSINIYAYKNLLMQWLKNLIINQILKMFYF